MSTFPVTLMPIAKIRTDGGTQSRVKLDESVIEEYAEAMENGAKFPPVVLFSDKIDHWLAHGFHRKEAAEKAGLTRIEAEIRPGSLLDAQWYSFGVNKIHGLRRSNEDKQAAVRGALEHEKGRERSAGAIAEHCGVSDTLVLAIKKKMAEQGSGPRVLDLTGESEGEKVTGKDGKKYPARMPTKKTTTTTTTVTVEEEEEPEAAFVEEHEEPKEAAVVEVRTDGLGRPVPAELDPAFRLVNAGFDAIRNKVIAARTLWNELQAELESHPWVRRSPDFCVIEDEIEKLQILVRDLTSYAPYAPCVYCGAIAPGDSQEACEGCRGSSWLSKSSYSAAPQMLRENAA